ncbi:hypothetical protein C8J56DRAFT_138587 [Mycena floridula]|nr:hypothetical protein C8J56DRAFT_138587 [Mycena floridula]
MSFTSLFLIALSVLPSSVLAAPIPHHHLLSRSTGKSLEPRADTGSSGWPKSSDFSKEKADFGVSGNFQEEYLTTLDGEPVLVGNYPKGSYAGAKTPPSGPGIAGFIFEAAGTDELGETVRLSYDVKFDEDFDFVRGGKLPGLYGGSDPATAKTCAGGHHDDSCWSARIMWREDGKGELYAYLSSANEGLAVCKGKCDVKYGASIDTGAWTFKAGEWTTITEEVTVGTKTGSIKVSVNGDQKIMVDNLTLAGKTRGAMIHTFFGGSSTSTFQSSKDQKAHFRNFSIKTVS